MLVRILNYTGPQLGSLIAKMGEMKTQLHPIFPSSKDDVLLCFFSCNYCPTDMISIKGQLLIGRDGFYFIGTRIEDAVELDVPKNVQLSMQYRQVSILEIVNGKRILGPDLIQIGIKDRSVSRSLYNSFTVHVCSFFSPKRSVQNFV